MAHARPLPCARPTPLSSTQTNAHSPPSCHPPSPPHHFAHVAALSFEWAEGWEAKFGLFACDPRTQVRTLRPSANILRSVVARHASGEAVLHRPAPAPTPPGGASGDASGSGSGSDEGMIPILPASAPAPAPAAAHAPPQQHHSQTMQPAPAARQPAAPFAAVHEPPPAAGAPFADAPTPVQSLPAGGTRGDPLDEQPPVEAADQATQGAMPTLDKLERAQQPASDGHADRLSQAPTAAVGGPNLPERAQTDRND